LFVGVLETCRRRHAAVGRTFASFLVANAIEGGEHLLAKLGGFAKDRLNHVGRGIGETGQIAVTIDMEDVVEQKQRIIHWSLVGRHDPLPGKTPRDVNRV